MHVQVNDGEGPGAWCSAVVSDLACALRVPSNRLVPGGPCTEIVGDVMYVNFNVYGSSGTRAESASALLARLQAQIANPGSPVWKGYATTVSYTHLTLPTKRIV